MARGWPCAVAVLDLDVEAPGVGPLLLDRKDTDAGIVDYMLERELGINGLGIEQILVNLYEDDLEGLEKPIRVFPAGRLTPTYLEKIARLDYEGFASDFAPSNPLARLLQEIREYDSDLEFFLLDLRAGLHDLGGFSLNGLSHLNILFGLDTQQSWNGYEIVLPLIRRKQPGERQELFFVHAMATPPRIDPYANQRFRQRAYDLLQKHYYGPDEDMLDLQDPDAPYGIPIFYRETLLNVRRLADVLPEIVNPAGDYQRLANLIGVYLSRQTL
ncbi:MAG: hypothetical protein RMK65_06575 [Anaerolineae bacterium]|nr:hypothetical protein [Anaerolineae bacterium]